MHVLATFYYLKPSPIWKTVRPYFIYIPQKALPEGQLTTNEESMTVHNVHVTDIRTHGDTFELDKHGFEIVQQDLYQYVDDSVHKGQFTNSAYANALAEFLKRKLDAETVVMISGTKRERDQSFPSRTWGTTASQQPIQGVHVGT